MQLVPTYRTSKRLIVIICVTSFFYWDCNKYTYSRKRIFYKIRLREYVYFVLLYQL